MPGLAISQGYYQDQTTSKSTLNGETHYTSETEISDFIKVMFTTHKCDFTKHLLDS